MVKLTRATDSPSQPIPPHADLVENTLYAQGFAKRCEGHLPTWEANPSFGCRVSINGAIMCVSYYAPRESKVHNYSNPVNINQPNRQFMHELKENFNAILNFAIKDMSKYGPMIYDRPKNHREAPPINEWIKYDQDII